MDLRIKKTETFGTSFVKTKFEFENCAPMGYYAVLISQRHFGTTYRSHIQGSGIHTRLVPEGSFSYVSIQI